MMMMVIVMKMAMLVVMMMIEKKMTFNIEDNAVGYDSDIDDPSLLEVLESVAVTGATEKMMTMVMVMVMTMTMMLMFWDEWTYAVAYGWVGGEKVPE